MNRRNVFFNLAAVAVLVPCLSLTMFQSPVQDDSARIAELEKSVAGLQEQLKKMESDLALVNGLKKVLVQGAQVLDRAADQSRADGFESAGPNPKAKTELLDGLKKFAATISNIPKLEKKAAPKKKRTGIW